MILNSFYALIASLGFGILFNIKGKNLILSALGGAIGWFFYLLSMKFSSSKLFSLFIASLAVSIYSEIMARIFKTPVTMFVICALLPLVPGAGMYYTMYEYISGDISSFLSLCFETLSSAGAIALATILVTSITKVIIEIKKKIFKTQIKYLKRK